MAIVCPYASLYIIIESNHTVCVVEYLKSEYYYATINYVY